MMAQYTINKFRKNLRNFIIQTQKKREKQRKDILRIIKKTVPDFLTKFGPIKKLSVIGSVAKKEFYSEQSDVDILVTGLKTKDYFKALIFWENKLNTKVDLIMEEDIPPKTRRILKREVTIYEDEDT